MTERRPYTRHGLGAPLVKIKLRGFKAVDQRSIGARVALAFKRDLISALGGEDGLSPQRLKLVELASRASLLLDHVDAWIFEQRGLVNIRNRSLMPVLVQRQTVAEHLAKLLDRLGLDRVPQKVQTLSSYVVEKYSPEKNGATAEQAERAEQMRLAKRAKAAEGVTREPVKREPVIVESTPTVIDTSEPVVIDVPARPDEATS
ncbi:MAG: hypothetical protein A3I00_05780 [Betaproteobacteria bacterium RIFCSPLOWO2_02_FULL_64_12]|nr:MAG: hypothetical protein A3I00_05780 [Betaproteobacteria bacterium RIFCSPLOWO2_02_FULL_64_12]